MSADIKVPPNMSSMEIGLLYRCNNCEIQNAKDNVGIVELTR